MVRRRNPNTHKPGIDPTETCARCVYRSGYVRPIETNIPLTEEQLPLWLAAAACNFGRAIEPVRRPEIECLFEAWIRRIVRTGTHAGARNPRTVGLKHEGSPVHRWLLDFAG